MWLNAAAKSRALRLEALPRSLPSGSQSCLICVGRPHPLWGGPGQRSYLGWGFGGIAAHGGEDDVGQSPLQASQRFAFCFAGAAFAFVVGAAFGVAADLGERDRVSARFIWRFPPGLKR